MQNSTLYLSPAFFSEKEKTLLTCGALTASAFRYDSGVCALRLKNERGELVILTTHRVFRNMTLLSL